MARPISLFSGYSQRENRVTNYCLLVLKMLYEENPKFLAEVMRDLFSADVEDLVGVQFRQQAKSASGSIPDGVICQQPFTVYIETKNYDWFYDAQLQQHLDGLLASCPGLKVLIALGKFQTGEEGRFERIHQLCDTKYEGSVIFRAVTFEQFAEALRLEHLPKNLSDTIEEFVAYLRAEGYFASWRNWLDVVNCAGRADDVLQHRAYLCPAQPGAYKHDRCKFFGMYRDKRVSQVALIEALVEVMPDGSAGISWKNVDQCTVELKKRAQEAVRACRPQTKKPHRVFLLGALHETDFRKESKGGMFGSKRYFDVGSLKADTAEELARSLRGRRWSDLA